MKNMLGVIALFVCALLDGSLSFGALKVTVFDVGQGNCVLISTEDNQHGLLVDAGSRELAFSALYQELFGYDKTRYWLQEAGQKFTSEIDEDDSEDSESLLNAEIFESEEEEQSAVDTVKGPEKLRKAYQKRRIKAIASAVSTVENLTVVISHPDEDHYNFLPEIFPNIFIYQDKKKFRKYFLFLGAGLKIITAR